MTGVAAALAGDLAWLALALLLAEGAARIGIAAWPGGTRRPALERFGIGLLMGWLAFGYAAYGLALTGLFLPRALVGLFVVLALAGWRRTRERSLVRAAAESWAGADRWWVLAVAAAVLPWAPRWLLPELSHDGYLYHLAAPWQFLQAHRALLTNVPFEFHYPLPVEMAYALPLALGDDRLAKAVVAQAFVAALAVWAAPRAGRRPRPLWPGVLLALAGAHVVELLGTCKNDLPAAAFFVAGALLWRRRDWATGGLLLGCGLTAKLTAAPLVVVWIAGCPPPRSRLGRMASALAAPLAPWAAASWLGTGDPVFPFGHRWFASYDWTEANQATLHRFMGDAMRAPTVEFPFRAVTGWLFGVVRVNPLLPVVAGLALWRPRLRRAAAVLLLAQLLTTGLRDEPRYLVPAVWMLTLLGAEALDDLPAAWRRKAAVALGAAALARALAGAELADAGWDRLGRTPAAVRAVSLSTYEEMVGALATRHPVRVLTAGERLAYRLPGRVVGEGQLGETPPIWKLVREAADADRVRVGFRQLGCGWLLFNYVSADGRAIRYVPFGWSPAMLRRYLAFAVRHLAVAGRTETSDYNLGGYVLYEILARPAAKPDRAPWFLPGTEQLYGDVPALVARGRLAESAARCEAVTHLLPEVGHSWNELGNALMHQGDVARAARVLKPWIDRGQIDEVNLADYGTAIGYLGRYAEADAVLRRARTIQLALRGSIDLNLARLGARWAWAAMSQGDFATAKTVTDRAERDLEDLGPDDVAPLLRGTTLATLMRIRSEMCLRLGEAAQAKAYAAEADRILQATPGATAAIAAAAASATGAR